MVEQFLSSRNCVLIFASFMISFTVLGTSRLITILFVATIRRYEAGRKQASLPFFLSGMMRCISGPLTGYLGRKFGSEIVTILGCILSAIGVGTCFFAEDYIGVTVSWGVIFGLGLGLGTSLISEILNRNFVRHIDKANGIFLGGECFGAIVLVNITYLLLNTYGTSGTFLILSGILLNSVPAAMILMSFRSEGKSPLITTNAIIHSNDVEMHQPFLAVESGLKRDKTNGFHSTLPSRDCIENRSSCLEMLRIHSSNGKEVGDSEEMPTRPAEEASSNPVHSEKLIHFQSAECSRERSSIPKESAIGKPFQVLMDPTFIIILFTQSSLQFALTTIFTVCVDFFRDLGIVGYQEIYLLMGFAFSDTVGRFFLGSITDAGFMKKINFYVLCQVLMAIAMISYVPAHGFGTLMASTCASGLISGGLMMASPGIMSLYIEQDDVLMAMACRYSFYPLMSVAQPFLIEYFRESLGSYKGLLLLIAGLNFTCSLLSLFIPVTARLRTRSIPQKI